MENIKEKLPDKVGLEALSKEDLEKQKLIREIRNSKIQRQPAFWTFITVLLSAAISTALGWHSGIFQKERIEVQKEKIELENEKLNMRKDSLSAQLEALINQIDTKTKEVDSVLIIADKYKIQIDSLKKLKKVLESKKLTKKQIIAEITNITIRLRPMLIDYRNKSSNIHGIKDFEEMRKISSDASDALMNTYNLEYKSKAKFYRDQAGLFVPSAINLQNHNFFEHPTNPLGVEAVCDELEAILLNLKLIE